MRPDIRKTLPVLREEWQECRKCNLGIQRENSNGSFVFGEGARRGIMFIGEGPGKEEEEFGRPFIGQSGDLLRKILTGLGFTDHYITNLVACRSCEPRLDENQIPMFRGGKGGRKKEIWMQDMPPKPMEWGACLARLHEEIYLVDPVVIVSLGGTAAEALTGKPVTITRDHGQPREIQIPGAGYEAILTEKKREWYHKVRGEVVAPMRQATVGYLLVPALHPAYVLRKIADKDPKSSPFKLLVEDIRNAIKIYEEYIKYAFHASVSTKSDTPWEDVEDYYRQEIPE